MRSHVLKTLLAVVLLLCLTGFSCSSSPAASGGTATPSAAAEGSGQFVMPDDLPPITENKELHFARAEDLLRLAQEKQYAELERMIDGWLQTRLDRDSRYNLDLLGRQLAGLPGIEARLDEWQQAFPQAHYPHLVRGIRHINLAWASRGSGWSSEVTAAGRQGMQEHISLARAELEQAKALRPADPNCAANLITVELGQGGNKGAMEQLFAEVMAQDPFHTPAYFSKLNFLYPKWHGSWEEARAVVDEATARGSYNPHLYLLLGMYHREQYQRTEQAERSKYYRQPEIQDELTAHYDKAVAEFPDDFLLHASYAKDLWACRQSEPALREYARATALADSGSLDFQDEDSEIGLAETYNFYAWILATSPNDQYRDGQRALACAKKANALRPDWMYGLDTLGEAYAEAGDFANAILCMKKAIALSDVAGMTRHMERNILLFEQGQPFRSRYY